MVMEPTVSPTQLTGMIAFAIAACCAARAATTQPALERAPRQAWWLVSIGHLLFLVEVWMGTRHVIHDHINGMLRDVGIYADRAALQLSLLLLCGLLVPIVGAMTKQKMNRTHGLTVNVRLAAWFTLAVVLLFMVESVSLHAVDRVLYRSVGPILLIGYLWGTAAMVVARLSFEKI